MIDLRSDTVTVPTPSMKKAMSAAKVGDDVYGSDPTVNELEAQSAKKLGFEAALYAASGTQTNLIALLTHCQRGDEYIVGQQAHTYKYEAGGAAVLGSIQPQPIDAREDGTLALESIEAAIKPDDPHFARTRLLAIENTFHGRPLPMDYLPAARELADSKGLILHLDGARIFNASVHHGVDVKKISKHFDSVSVCLSKGLCAPVGSLLCGSAEFIHEARRWRKMLGGGMRQAGYIAAAGLVALTENVERLQFDHDHARALFEGLRDIDELHMTEDSVQTNMVFLPCGKRVATELAAFLESKKIIISVGETVRLVLHKDVDIDDVIKVTSQCKKFFS